MWGASTLAAEARSLMPKPPATQAELNIKRGEKLRKQEPLSDEEMDQWQEEMKEMLGLKDVKELLPF